MKNNLLITLIVALLSYFYGNAQYVFTGSIESEKWKGAAYLSVIDDYRKISGVHPEQIISKTAIINNTFKFKGDNLDAQNKIYKIHVDNCIDTLQNTDHIEGYCTNSQEFIFIANNRDTIDLPISSFDQMFCSIASTNTSADAFFKIDSLKELMRYDYSTYRSEANRKLNNKKWFTTFQQFGKQLNEPLAEIYIYNFLSDRTSDLYSYYLDDLKSNNYYNELLQTLEEKYENMPYYKQYKMELLADKYSISETIMPTFFWGYFLCFLLGLSILVNVILYRKWKQPAQLKKRHLTNQLTKQEQKILNLILKDKTNKEIATEVFVSVSTVKTHINNLYKKLNLSSRDEVKKLFNGSY